MARNSLGKRGAVPGHRRAFGDSSRTPGTRHEEGRNRGRVYVLRLNDEAISTSITLLSEDLLGRTEFLVDTGSEPNILKIDKADGDLLCNETDKIKLSGITRETITTLATVNINIHGHTVKFHLVPDSFPIPYDGILGSEILQRTAKINYENESVEWYGIIMPFARAKEITIPGQTSEVCSIRINIALETGYVPRLEFGEGIYAGEALVTNQQ